MKNEKPRINKALTVEDEIANMKAIIRDQKATIFQLKTVIDNIPGDIYWKDPQGVYLGLNRKGSESLHKMGFQWQASDILGKTDYDIYDQKTAATYIANDQKVMQSGLESTSEEAMHLPSGEEMVQISIKRPLYDEDGNIAGIVGNTTDITYLKKIETNLRIARDAADAASIAKTMFLANMSHDLKTPLAGIISTAEYLSLSLDQAEAKNRATDIVQSGMRLLDLLVEIIEVSRLDTNAPINHAAFQPKTLIDDIIQLIKPAIINKNLLFKVYYQDTIPTALIGDRWQLYRIILNLLSNAIKFTQAGSISLSIVVESHTADQVTLKISVKDSGIGIPLDKQAIIFDEFTRLTHAHDENYKGTGLGLAIVKKFIEAMHGTIAITSIENQGSTFTCLIPLKTVKPLIQALQTSSITETTVSNKPVVTTHTPPNNADIFAGVTILLVEDNPLAGRAAKAILQSLGCSVDIAPTGHAAVEYSKEKAYDFIYLDLGLPDMHGCEVSRQLRQLALATTTPIVALSAHMDAATQASCIAAGMTDALTKPLLRENAKQTLQKYIMPPADALKIIDLDSGAATLGVDLETAKEALATLIHQLPNDHAAIVHAYNQQNHEALLKATHKLQGSLLYCGVPALTKAVIDLEIAVKKNPNAELTLLFDRYCREIQRLTDEYKNMGE